tara:strand:- start:25 stop:261 length:237 start_codon:yes stop_codon:yes gene_type:complete
MTKHNEHGLDHWCGAALRVRRQAAGMTLQELADKMGSTTSTLHRWEGEVHPPSSKDIEQMAVLFQSEPVDFSRAPRVV